MRSGLWVCVQEHTTGTQIDPLNEDFRWHLGAVRYWEPKSPNEDEPDPRFWKALHLHTASDSVLSFQE